MVKRIKFGDLKIQKLNRVALPNSLLENLGLKPSDDVELFLDIEDNEIIIKKLKRRKNEK
ncbi:hypothetical protein HYW74_03735 [Candidatus Pacearchaeota archaeon]|nr:hypothetical protein [Candidatus Pacearchaeota archaeon]